MSNPDFLFVDHNIAYFTTLMRTYIMIRKVVYDIRQAGFMILVTLVKNRLQCETSTHIRRNLLKCFLVSIWSLDN